MNGLVFIAWGEYEGFADAVRCAIARANVPVRVVSDQLLFKGNYYWYPIAQFKDIGADILKLPGSDDGLAYSLGRWFVLQQMIEHNLIQPPLFCADWDMLITAPLAEAYQPFLKYDFAVSVIDQHNRSAAYGINRLEPLNAFCDQISSMLRNRSPRLAWMEDMAGWRDVATVHGWTAGDLFTPQNGSVFDHNMHEPGCFEMNGEAKKLVFQDQDPYFIRKSDQQLVRANCLHCWGSYKTKTSWLLNQMGVK